MIFLQWTFYRSLVDPTVRASGIYQNNTQPEISGLYVERVKTIC